MRSCHQRDCGRPGVGPSFPVKWLWYWTSITPSSAASSGGIACMRSKPSVTRPGQVVVCFFTGVIDPQKPGLHTLCIFFAGAECSRSYIAFCYTCLEENSNRECFWTFVSIKRRPILLQSRHLPKFGICHICCYQCNKKSSEGVTLKSVDCRS